MNCSACGAHNRDAARFCGACGAPMSSTEPASNPSLGEAPAMIGREIAGRYRMLAKLGEGGMGTVYRAEQISLKRTVAVKLLRPDVLGNQLLLRRFNAEAEAVAKLSHPNTVNIYDFGQDADGMLFIAMEYIEGRSLRSVIQHEAPLPPRRALAIALQVAASLADAHARAIVHRDLKPDNVMLQDRGRERDIARVLDFGIAKLRDDTRATQLQMTQQGDMLGTPQYMAPEQIRAEAIDGRTDIYALGCMIYEMVTARLPHEASTVLALLSKHLLEHPVPPSQRRPELGLPIGLDLLIQGAMAKDPAARPPTMEAFGEHIAALLAAQPPDPHSAQRSAVGPAVRPPAPGPVSRADTPAANSAFQPPPYVPPQVPPPPALPSAPGTMPGAGGTGVTPPPFAIPPPPSRKATIIALAAILAVGAALAAVVLGVRSTQPMADAGPSDDQDQRDDGDDASAQDPWGAPSSASGPAQWDPSMSIDGDRREVGQGVTVIFPPGFQTTAQNGATIAWDARGVMIASGPIEIASSDPKQIARAHAKRTGLVLESMQDVYVGGVKRALGIYHGTVSGVAVRHAALALIGPSYRLLVMFQAPTQLVAADPSITPLLFEVYAQRVVLP